jgi:hypothetical protein
LGVGRHPVSGLDGGFIATYVDVRDEEPAVGATLFNIWGQPEHFVEVSQGASPIFDANPVAAALPGGSYAVAWGDFDGDGSDLGVALRRVAANGSLGSLSSANSGKEFSQLNPDVLWTGSELVVAWEDYSDPASGPDIRYRTFDAQLTPTSGDLPLANGPSPEAAVALAPFNGGWAAAYRQGLADGRENVVVRAAERTFTVGPIWGGPIDDRPALVALDATHMLLAFSGDPQAAGTVNVPRVRYAVIDTSSVSAPVMRSLDPMDDVLTSDAQVAQTSPSLEQSAAGAFLAWRSEARPGDAAGDELWLKQLRWSTNGTSSSLHVDEAELLIPRTCDEGIGDQRVPALGRTQLPPGGALVVAWNDFAKSQGAQAGEPEVVVHYAPTHLSAPAGAPQTLSETWSGTTGSPWPTRWSSNMAPPVTFSTQYGEGEFNAFSLPGSGVALVNDHRAENVDIVTTVRMGYPPYVTLVARADDAATPTNYLGALITTRKAETWRLFSMVNGVITNLQTIPVPVTFWEVGIGVGVDYRVRFRTETQSDGSLFLGMKVWRRGASEPAAWLLQRTLTTTTTPTAAQTLGGVAGRFGLAASILTGNGGKLAFDDFSATFFEGTTDGDLDVPVSPHPLLLPRTTAIYRRCNGTSPCTLTEGCCSGDGDCAAGLACSRLQSEGLGLGSHANVCAPQGCTNQLKDGSEVRADCGGPDCKACACTSAVALGVAGYCSPSCACGVGEYPCSHNSHCLPGLLCGVDTGEPFGGPYGSDACVPPHCVNRVQDADETKIDCGGSCGNQCESVCSTTNGADGHCRTYCPCAAGHGLCSLDDECVSPLVCASEGVRFGFATNINVCVPAHCINNIKDAAETSNDCGGGCGCGGCPAGCVN